MFSANDQSVPVLGFSHDGSLLAEGRRSWVALWDMQELSSPQRLGAVGAATSASPPRSPCSTTAGCSPPRPPRQLAVWDALGDGSPANAAGARAAPTAGSSTFSVGRGTAVPCSSATRSFDEVALVDIETGTSPRHPSARPTRTDPPSALPPVSWTSSPVARRPHGGQTSTSPGRGFAFDTADGHLITGLTGGHTSLVSSSYFNDAGMLITASVDGSLRMWNPWASETDVSADLSDDLCREFGGRIDDDKLGARFRGRRPRRAVCGCEAARAPRRSRCQTPPTSARLAGSELTRARWSSRTPSRARRRTPTGQQPLVNRHRHHRDQGRPLPDGGQRGR